MNTYKNAPLTPTGRERMVKMVLAGKSRTRIAKEIGVATRTVSKWVKRYLADGAAGLQDRSSRPHKLRDQTPAETRKRIIKLRWRRLTMTHIAQLTGVSKSTVSRLLKKVGLSRLHLIEPPPPVRRYQRDNPGEMIHIDIKRLGRFSRTGHRITGDRTGQANTRGVGWEYVHVCVDDASRLAFTEIHPDEKALSAIAFLKALCLA